MKNLNDAGARKALTRAAELLLENAKELLQSHTIGGDGNWTGEEEAKAAHDELIAVAGRLTALLGVKVEEASLVTAGAENEDSEMRQALRFYAEGNHFIPVNPDDWESVSGEPGNFLEDEAHTATVEDGTVAKRALAAKRA
ncbi:hypothetical protein [Hydrogenophaga sp. 2FB]|uniref:hypothetical protein n=1 Tax=Hydrogenophaga sp. 2FB TaxID=2502187 RepID=UPI0010F8EE5D|nr:hypothetical protein [Hydrogenophaga sp. 2FB]